jgi:hypothetical protein
MEILIDLLEKQGGFLPAAQCRVFHLDNDVLWVLNLRHWSILNDHLVRALEHNGAHSFLRHG